MNFTCRWRRVTPSRTFCRGLSRGYPSNKQTNKKFIQSLSSCTHDGLNLCRTMPTDKVLQILPQRGRTNSSSMKLSAQNFAENPLNKAKKIKKVQNYQSQHYKWNSKLGLLCRKYTCIGKRETERNRKTQDLFTAINLSYIFQNCGNWIKNSGESIKGVEHLLLTCNYYASMNLWFAVIRWRSVWGLIIQHITLEHWTSSLTAVKLSGCFTFFVVTTSLFTHILTWPWNQVRRGGKVNFVIH